MVDSELGKIKMGDGRLVASPVAPRSGDVLPPEVIAEAGRMGIANTVLLLHENKQLRKERDNWKEDARMMTQNREYWRGKFLEAHSALMECWSNCNCEWSSAWVEKVKPIIGAGKDDAHP